MSPEPGISETDHAGKDGPQTTKPSAPPGHEDWVRRTGRAIVAAGILLRLIQYFFDRSLFIDEAALALNIRNRTLAELFSMPLAGGQSGPPFHIVTLRALVSAFGDSELVLRLPSTIAGILSVILFARLSREFTAGFARLIALTLFCCSFPLVYFSADAKPYAIDVMACVAMLLLAAPLRGGRLEARRAGLLAGGGVVLALLSQPMVFVLASLTILLVGAFIRRRDWQSLRILAPVLIAWSAAMYACFSYGQQALGRDGVDYMRTFWKDSFLPFPPLSVADFMHYSLTALSFGLSPIGSAFPGVVLFAGIGAVALSRSNRWGLGLLLLPVGLTITASVLERYPFGGTTPIYWADGRVVLFLAPLVILLIACGLELMAGSSYRLQRKIVAVIGAVVVAANLGLFVRFPFKREETRSILQSVKGAYQEGDVVYVYYGARYPYDYYSTRLQFEPGRVFLGSCQRQDPEAYLWELAQLRGEPRVWFIISHPFADEWPYIRGFLQASAVELQTYEDKGSRAALLDFSNLDPSAISAYAPTEGGLTDPRHLGWECGRGIHTYPFNGWDSPERIPLGDLTRKATASVRPH